MYCNIQSDTLLYSSLVHSYETVINSFNENSSSAVASFSHKSDDVSLK